MFLPIVLVLYYLVRPEFKNTVLLAASLFFYAWGEPKYVILMIISIVMNYFFALLIDFNRDRSKLSKRILGVMVLCNLSMLGIFKYTNFVVDIINGFFNMSISIPQIPLPIGISFFTFQAMSYVIDVYRKDGEVQKNPQNMALYISLFPQLIAGPIVRYQTVANQIKIRTENFEKFSNGVKRFIIGFSKKMILANNCGLVADHVFGLQPEEMSVGLSWIGIIAYSLQIYFDFSGYSDMAIGLGKMFGFEFLENFNYPYISNSIADFWRRWHISLGSWFRDYLYIPLGGNRCGNLKTYRNLLIVWFATGLWHGASWTFIAWGLYYGLFIMMERAFLGTILRKMPTVIQHIYSLIIVVIGWVFFRADTFGYAFSYIRTMFGVNGIGLWDPEAKFYICEYGIIIVVSIIAATPVFKILSQKTAQNKTNAGIAFLVETVTTVFYLSIFVLSITYVVSNTFNPFIYFRF